MKRSLFLELKRRNVYRPAILYIGGVWALAQGISQLGPAFGLPASATRWFVVAAAIGFPFWIALAWIYELTPEGLKRERDLEPDKQVPRRTARKLDMAIIGVLSVAVVLLLTNTFVWHKGVGSNGGQGDRAATVASVKTIAVLPFANLSSDKQQEYFAEGIAEDLLNLLARVRQLQVTARSSSFAFKGKGLGIHEIAQRLHVGHVLEGSVRKAGNRVRVTAGLVDAGTETQIWSKSYDRTLDDVFAIQDEIAADVVKQLQIELLGAEPTVRETDPQAYALYLQARELTHQFTAEAFARSDSLLYRVLAVDSTYAPAWDQLARNLTNEVGGGLLPVAGGAARAREAAEKAVEIDPGYAPAHSQLGWIAILFDNDLHEAARHFQRALELDPSDLRVLGNSTVLLQALGRLDEAVALGKIVVRRDPVSATRLYNLGNLQQWSGHLEEAAEAYRTALSLSPGQGATHYALGVTLMQQGDPAGALTEIQQETVDIWRMIGLPMAYQALGRQADADAALARLTATYEKDAPYNIAYVYAFRGDAGEAFAWLDKAVAYQDPGLSEIPVENLFDNIRGDPRWLPFLRKLHKAPDQLAKVRFKVTLPSDPETTGEAKKAS